MVVAAFQKAEALRRHLSGLRLLADRDQVTLNDREAWELLDWYRTQLPDDSRELYQQDLKRAQLMHDPWPMLEGFRVHGLLLTRTLEEFH
jgi:hypothetical protein